MIKHFFSSYIKYLGKSAESNIEKAVFSFLTQKQAASYLDCGCDDGKKTIARAKALNAKMTYGIENIPERGKQAKEKGITVYRASLNEKWPLEANTINVITATEVIEHLVDLDNFFTEAKRVLRKKGTIILSTENLASFHNLLALLVGRQPFTGPYLSKKFSISGGANAQFYQYSIPMDPHLNVMTAKALIKLMKFYGFRKIQSKHVGYYPFPPIIATILSKIDWWHASYVIVKGEK